MSFLNLVGRCPLFTPSFANVVKWTDGFLGRNVGLERPEELPGKKGGHIGRD